MNGFPGSNGWLDMIRKYGYPTVLSAVLLGVLLGWIPSNFGDFRKLSADHVALANEITATSSELDTLFTKLSKVQEYQLRILRTMCSHSAKTEQERDECLAIE